MDDLDDHLARSDRAEHFLPDRFLGDLINEIARDRQRDVGLEQGDAHFAHGGAHVGFRERAAPAKPIEYAAKPVAQAIEHPSLLAMTMPETRNTPADETSSASVHPWAQLIMLSKSTVRRLVEAAASVKEMPAQAAERSASARGWARA
jgi:hypothetical protein